MLVPKTVTVSSCVTILADICHQSHLATQRRPRYQQCGNFERATRHHACLPVESFSLLVQTSLEFASHTAPSLVGAVQMRTELMSRAVQRSIPRCHAGAGCGFRAALASFLKRPKAFYECWSSSKTAIPKSHNFYFDACRQRHMVDDELGSMTTQRYESCVQFNVSLGVSCSGDCWPWSVIPRMPLTLCSQVKRRCRQFWAVSNISTRRPSLIKENSKPVAPDRVQNSAHDVLPLTVSLETKACAFSPQRDASKDDAVRVSSFTPWRYTVRANRIVQKFSLLSLTGTAGVSFIVILLSCDIVILRVLS